MAEERSFFAQLTPPGEGGIAVFSVEGPGARAALAAAMNSERIRKLAPGELAYGKLLAGDGSVLDEVIVAALPAAGGAERFELNCHAGGAAAAAAAERLASLGLVRREPPPEPGLGAIERDFRDALAAVRTRRQLAALCAARAALPGALDRAREALSDPAQAAALLGGMLEESSRLERLLAAHRAAIAGPANAGKSTLFNRLAGADRAITSPHPGTTRDVVEARVALRGLSVELADTAGLGPPGDGELARRSEEMARRRAAGAELVLAVLDGSEAPGEAHRAEIGSLAGERAGPALVVVNKSDLPVNPQAMRLAAELGGGRELRVSARTGAGMPGLLAALERALLPRAPSGGAAALGPLTREKLAAAYTCAGRAAVENNGAVAAEAAGILGAVLEGPV